MPTARLTPEQIAQVSGLVAQYIARQRETYSPRAVPAVSTTEDCDARIFFTATLDSARLLVLKGERVGNPDFYPMLRSLGFNNLPD